MAKVSPAFTSFSAGEFSPKMDGRTDLQKYTQACKKLENMFVHPQGSARRRPGTKFVQEVKNSAHNARLIPFEFNTEQSYILEFGDQYFRVHKDGGTVVSSGSPIEFTTPYLHTELSDLSFTQSGNTLFIAHQHHHPKKIFRSSHTAWTIADVDFQRGPMLDPNDTTKTLTASSRTGSVTITAANVGITLTFFSNDVGRLVKLHHGFAKITGFTNNNVVTATVQENERGVAELSPIITTDTISFHEGDPNNTGNEHNDRIEDSAGGFLNAGFEAGMSVSVTGTTSNNVSNVIIAEVTSTRMLLAPGADLADEAADTGHTITGDLLPDNNFRLGAFKDGFNTLSTPKTFPGVVALHEQRLVFGNTLKQPRTLFFSKSTEFENFTPGTADASSMTFELASAAANEIRYLQPGRFLQVGTSGGEFVVTSATEGPLTPTTTQIVKQGTVGTAKIPPIGIGNVTLFVQRAKRKIREFVFDLQSDSYQAPELTLLAEHITEGGIKEMAYQQEPEDIVWVCLNNGKLVGLTYRREENVVAWHSHSIGGTSSNGSYGSVHSLACIPGDLDQDDVYMVVERTINSATKKYVEILADYDFGTNTEDAFFVDSGLTYSGSSANTISGLTHLEGQTVAVLANGAAHANKTVSSGAISLDVNVTKAHVGLPFTSTLQTMRLDAGSAQGTSQGKIKRIHDITVRFFRTVGCDVGTSETELDSIPFRAAGASMSAAIPLFDGDKEIEFRGGFEQDAHIVVQQTQPLPMTIIGLFPRLITFDE